ncbi:GNAT family N-acetyltransferase [Magnetofaba australis]|uniref:GNAT family N-acetyltransferase n=1 Tax=Magnetofaba australis TaxID=1472297 RepID=UPI0013019D6A|nr:GNAT family N-acetyltransferase [Magnetofaba australis]
MEPLTLRHAPPSAEIYNALRSAVGWPAIDPAITAPALADSRYAVTLMAGDQPVGCGRVIGDGIYYYIQDVIVIPDYQGRGCGAQIVDALMAWLQQNAPGRFIGLMAAAGKSRFYEKYGFEAHDADRPGMSRRA